MTTSDRVPWTLASGSTRAKSMARTCRATSKGSSFEPPRSLVVRPQRRWSALVTGSSDLHGRLGREYTRLVRAVDAPVACSSSLVSETSRSAPQPWRWNPWRTRRLRRCARRLRRCDRPRHGCGCHQVPPILPAMTSSGRSLWRLRFMQSITAELRESPAPLLVVGDSDGSS